MASSGTDITRLLAGNPRPDSASSSSSEIHTRSNSRLVESVDRQSELSLLNPEQNLTNKFSSASVFFSRQLQKQQYAINPLILAHKEYAHSGIHHFTCLICSSLISWKKSRKRKRMLIDYKVK
jgi:hypothetical protein